MSATQAPKIVPPVRVTSWPVDLIVERLTNMASYESKSQTAYAIIGALEQNGWLIVRKRHHGGR